MCELEKKKEKVQVAILLHAAGLEAQEIHKQFVYSENESKGSLETVQKKFGAYCKPRRNTVFERYKFWGRNEVHGESIDAWVKDL